MTDGWYQDKGGTWVRLEWKTHLFDEDGNFLGQDDSNSLDEDEDGDGA